MPFPYALPILQYSNTPLLQFFNTPTLHFLLKMTGVAIREG
jgi:hypothetical protein